MRKLKRLRREYPEYILRRIIAEKIEIYMEAIQSCNSSIRSTSLQPQKRSNRHRVSMVYQDKLSKVPWKLSIRFTISRSPQNGPQLNVVELGHHRPVEARWTTPVDRRFSRSFRRSRCCLPLFTWWDLFGRFDSFPAPARRTGFGLVSCSTLPKFDSPEVSIPSRLALIGLY